MGGRQQGTGAGAQSLGVPNAMVPGCAGPVRYGSCCAAQSANPGL